MTRIWEYEGHIGALSYRKNYFGELIIETVVLHADDEDHIAPVLLNVAAGLFGYIDDLEGHDDEERYLKKRFFYNDILEIVGIEVLNRDGEICKAVFDTTTSRDWTHKTFGPEERLTAYNPTPLDAETQRAVAQHVKDMRLAR